jgi:hypothetical protein
MRKIVWLTIVLALLALVPVAAQDEPVVHIRVAHFSPDTPAVDVYINGSLSDVQGLAFPNVTGWITLEPGTYQLAVTAAGDTAPAIGPASFDLPADAWLTIAAVGSLEEGTLKPAIVAEDYSEMAEGETRVTVFHGIEGAQPVDVLAGGSAVIEVLAFPGALGANDGAQTLNVPAGIYDLEVFLTAERLEQFRLFDLPDTILVAGTNYFVAAVGTPAEPQVVVIPTRQ